MLRAGRPYLRLFVALALIGLMVRPVAAHAAPAHAKDRRNAASPTATPHRTNDSGDWAKFHYDLANTNYNPNETTLDTSNVGALGQLWGITTAGPVFGSPAVANGFVYIGSWDDNLYALDASTGAEQWSFATGSHVGDSSPAVANGVVYLGSDDDNLYALDASTGAELWSFSTGAGIESSPSVANGVVYVGSSDDNLYALDASTGAELWSFSTGGSIYSSPAVVNDVVYASSGDNHLYAVDATTGAELWSKDQGIAASSPSVANGVVYVGSGDDNLYALDASTGATLWIFGTLDVPLSPSVANGVVYVGSKGWDGDFFVPEVYALDATTGAELWNFMIDSPYNSLSGSPAVANGVAYVGSSVGLYALDASTGAELFTTGGYVSPPAVANGAVYIGQNNSVSAYTLIEFSPSVTVNVQGGNPGTVSSSPPGISCPPTCSASFDSGSAVTLTETPAPGGDPFVVWQGPCSEPDPTGPTCTLTNFFDAEVTANFGTPPTAPLSVTAGAGNGAASVSWEPPSDDGGLQITGYTIYAQASSGGPPVQAEVGPQTTGIIGGLTEDCSETYSFYVTATNLAGTGPPSGTTPAMRTSGNYSNPSANVLIFVGGLNSSLGAPPNGAAGWDPMPGLGSLDYCQPYRNTPKQLQDIAGYLKSDWNPPPKPPVLDFWTAMAASGAVILPFSYTSPAQVVTTGVGSGWSYQAEAYSAWDTRIANPASLGDVLANEVNSVHKAWPLANIVIVGHSLGGVIAEQFFERYHVYHQLDDGVTRVFSLDSPINGAQSAVNACFGGFFGLCLDPLINSMAALWLHRQSHDAFILSSDTGATYIPIGTWDDLAMALNASPCQSIVVQALYTTDPCFGPPNPTVEGPDVITPENNAPPWIPGYPTNPFQGCPTPISLWNCIYKSHSFVYRSPLVICLVRHLGLNDGPACPGYDRRAQPPTEEPARPTGSLSVSVVTPGQAVSIDGSGFGTRAGSVLFIGADGSAVPATLSSWSDTTISLEVPLGAATGFVQLTTADRFAALVGSVAVLGAPSDVVSLSVDVPPSTTLNGQPIDITVHASDAFGQPVPDAVAEVWDGATVLSATTDLNGDAAVSLIGFETQAFTAYSGSVAQPFTVTWTDPPVENLGMVADADTVPAGKPVTLTATLTDSEGQPVADAPIDFSVYGPATVELSASEVLTDANGIAAVTATSQVAAVATIAAVADDYALTQTVSATWLPLIKRVAPASGPEAGGTMVTITGRGFASPATVSFGLVAATDVTVNSTTNITATSPPGTGTVDVVVSEPGGATPTSRADRFTYLPIPSVTGVRPDTGPPEGGTTVTIRGANFVRGASVNFGPTPASDVAVLSSTKITATSPIGTGIVDVVVTTPGGSSLTSEADLFTYQGGAPRRTY